MIPNKYQAISLTIILTESVFRGLHPRFWCLRLSASFAKKRWDLYETTSHQKPPLFKFPAWTETLKKQASAVLFKISSIKLTSLKGWNIAKTGNACLNGRPSHQNPSLKGWHIRFLKCLRLSAWPLSCRSFCSEGFTLGFDVWGFQPLSQKSTGFFINHIPSAATFFQIPSLNWNTKETGVSCFIQNIVN